MNRRDRWAMYAAAALAVNEQSRPELWQDIAMRAASYADLMLALEDNRFDSEGKTADEQEHSS